MTIGEFFKKLFGGSSPKDPDPVSKAPKPSNGGDFPWMLQAQNKIGVHEVRGGENPEIIAFHAVTTLKATHDEVPWCSSFVSWCLEQVGIRSTRNAWAQSYASFGKRLSAPKYGCIVVFRWKDGTGHVAFFDSLNKDGTLKLLGGNQGDAVRFANYATDHVIAYRWPQ